MSYDLVAITPQQMEQSHESLIKWAEEGISDAKRKAREAKENYELAVSRKWKASYLRTIWKREEKRVHFFAKTRAACEAGFYIIPTFWMDTFAVRIPEGQKVPIRFVRSRYRPDSIELTEKDKKALPAGTGEYVDPNLSYYHWVEKKQDAKGQQYDEHVSRSADEWDGPTFPAVMAKRAIMDRTQEAMALKIFDEIGLIQQRRDPIIAGLIKHPKPGKNLLFFIAWNFDPSDF